MAGEIQLNSVSLATESGGTVTLNSSTDIKGCLNASGSAPIYACRAWVNFNGTGTVAIRDSGNVSSITDNGTGWYTVTFATAMPDANYSVCGSTGFSSNGVMGGFLGPHRSGSTGNEVAPSTTAVELNALYPSTTFDAKYVSVAIFR